MVNINVKRIEDMILKLQNSRGKTKLKFDQAFSNCYAEMN